VGGNISILCNGDGAHQDGKQSYCHKQTTKDFSITPSPLCHIYSEFRSWSL